MKDGGRGGWRRGKGSPRSWAPLLNAAHSEVYRRAAWTGDFSPRKVVWARALHFPCLREPDCFPRQARKISRMQIEVASVPAPALIAVLSPALDESKSIAYPQKLLDKCRLSGGAGKGTPPPLTKQTRDSPRFSTGNGVSQQRNGAG